MKQFNTDQKSSIIDKDPFLSPKLIRLKYLLENSENQFITALNPRSLAPDSTFNSPSKTEVSPSFRNSSSFSHSHTQIRNFDMSKNFSLYLSLIEKPINLLFSMDQFLFEFSKKTYQQKKTGEFFQQLKERKKLSLFYGNLTQKQILNLFNKVKKNKGYFAKNVFSLLERRLDVILYRTGLTKTIAEARQLIRHKKILVNQKIINVPSLLLNPGDFISITKKTEDVLSKQLIDSLKTKGVKNHPKIIGDFYSKLKKTLDFSLFLEKPQDNLKSQNLGKSNGFLIQKFQSKLLCTLWIQLLCTKIKTRSYWKVIKEEFSSNRMTLEKHQGPRNRKKFYLTLFKWMSFSHQNKFRKSLENSLSVRRKTNSEHDVFANNGCLQKKPVFWSRDLSNHKQKKKMYFKHSQKLQSLTQQMSHSEFDKKHFKMSNFKKKNLALYRKSFLLFLKHLENYKKFTSLVSLSMKKFLLKNSFYKQKFGDKYMYLSKFSKNFTFRLIRPLNIEVSYNLLNLIYLYSPQKVNFPFSIDLDLINRSLR